MPTKRIPFRRLSFWRWRLLENGSQFFEHGKTVLDFRSVRDLAGGQEGFDEFAFAAGRELLEAFEPFAVRDFGVGVEPCGQLFQGKSCDVSLANAGYKVPHEGVRYVRLLNLWHKIFRKNLP